MSKNKNNDALHVLTNGQHLPMASAQDRLADFISDHGRTILTLIGSVIFILLAIYIWGLWTQGKDERDYTSAAMAFEQLEMANINDGSPALNASYLELKNIIEKHPELASRYNGPLAQTFLRLGDMELAVYYADKALKQLVDESLPFYEDYSKTSLIIAGENYADAYKRSAFLGKRMLDAAATEGATVQTRGFGDTLLIFNQIRLAALQQKLGSSADELRTWQALRAMPGSANTLKAIQTGKTSFTDYMNVHETQLTAPSKKN